MRSDLRIVRLTGSLGAEVRGVDLTRVTPSEVAALRAAWATHKVLFFRGQPLDPVAQVAVARRFGEPTLAHPLIPGHPDAPEVLVLDSAGYELGVGRKGEGTSYNDRWHTDVTFAAAPPAASLLTAVVLPEFGGDTLWADLERAFEALSPGMQRYLEGLVALHDGRQAFGEVVRADADERRARLDALPPVRHPVVRVHPETGRRGLFVNPTFTARLEGLHADESDAVLRFLHAWIPIPERTVRWRWQVGDVALWDNRNTAHYAAADYGTSRRVMHRVTLAGDVPRGV